MKHLRDMPAEYRPEWPDWFLPDWPENIRASAWMLRTGRSSLTTPEDFGKEWQEYASALLAVGATDDEMAELRAELIAAFSPTEANIGHLKRLQASAPIRDIIREIESA